MGHLLQKEQKKKDVMFRNQYDQDCITFSPEGRIHQIEYAMEAVKQGSAAVGTKSKKHAVLATVKRSTDALASYQRKVFEVDDHCGIAIAGLTADARVLSKFMRTECLNHRFTFDTPLPIGRLVSTVADKSQINTQRSGGRPYGVGLLVAGVDATGPHLYNTCPSGNAFEYKSMAIGARSQSAKTYLESHFEEFEDCDAEALIKHVVTALNSTCGAETELTSKNLTVAIVGGDYETFTIMEDAAVEQYVAGLPSASAEAVPAADAPLT